MEENGNSRKVDGTFDDGNPGGPGRPKGALSLVKILREYLEREVTDEGEKKTRAKKFIENEYNRAIKGDPTARKHVWNYVEGLPQSKIDLTSGGKPIPILLNVPSDNSDKEDSSAQETP